MKLTLPVSFVVAAIVLTVAAILFVMADSSQLAHASAPSGLPATIATSSNPTVTTTASLVVATTSACAARIITTVASPVMITFGDTSFGGPTGTYGHLQPASTTVAYDSGLYGCGAVRIYSFVSSAITVSESR